MLQTVKNKKQHQQTNDDGWSTTWQCQQPRTQINTKALRQPSDCWGSRLLLDNIHVNFDWTHIQISTNINTHDQLWLDTYVNINKHYHMCQLLFDTYLNINTHYNILSTLIGNTDSNIHKQTISFPDWHSAPRKNTGTQA